MAQEIIFTDGAEVPGALARDLAEHGYSIRSGDAGWSADGQLALAVIDATAGNEGMDAIARLQRWRRRMPECPVLILVEPAQGALAGEAMRLGAMDYLLKPFTSEQFLAVADHVVRLHQPIADLVHVSHSSRQLLLLAMKAAQTAASILITGESGTGKERLARYIHDVSPRASGPYVAVNCAAIPANLLESTLFGHARGAFTGAAQSQAGKFELAEGGTLLLDEIADLPLELQAKLLRVLQEREVERVGSNQKIKLDVRIIAATNKDLRQQVAAGLFREDLYYRLDVLPLHWPALRERREDILPLAQFFLDRHASGGNFQINEEASRALVAYSWPGNVRELENVIQRALIMARGLILQVEDFQLPDLLSGSTAAGDQQDSDVIRQMAPGRRGAEFQYVLDTLRQFDGHRTRTADALGITTRALRYKLAAMRDHGIDINQYVAGRAL